MRRGALARFLAGRRRHRIVEALVHRRRIRARHAHGDRSSTPVVLLAGLGLAGRYLVPLGAELAPAHEVWIPELPGHGRSEVPLDRLDLPAMGDAIAAWMAAAGLARAVLIGNSMGCQVAVEVAARHPERVAALVLDAPTVDAAARSVVRQAGRIAVDALREPPSLGLLQVLEWAQTGPMRLIGTIRSAVTHEVEARLPAVRCPALVVRGGRDPIVSQAWAEQVASRLPHGELVVVAGGSHALPYSDPVALAALVEDFLQRAVDGES